MTLTRTFNVEATLPWLAGLSFTQGMIVRKGFESGVSPLVGDQVAALPERSWHGNVCKGFPHDSVCYRISA